MDQAQLKACGVEVESAKSLGMDPIALAQLATRLDQKYVASGKLPHLQILVSRDEQPLLSACFGTARDGGDLLRPDALYRIASMTKPVTSVAFMMLVEEGRVLLDDPVSKWIPEFAHLKVGVDRTGAPKRPMLMIDLLRHTSGLTYGLQRRTAIDARYREQGLDEFHQKRTPDEFIADLAAIPLEFSPGDHWNYSVATDVLGIVVERICDADLEDVFRKRIFEPLKMQDSFFTVPQEKVGRLTDAWRLDENQNRVLGDKGAKSAWSRSTKLRSGGGGLVSSMHDYHRFARMLLRNGELDGHRLLRAETVASMRANHLPDGRDLANMSVSMFSESDYAGVGFGLGVASISDTQDYFWGGVFSTYFIVDPIERTIGILMTQLMPSSAYALRPIFRSALRGALVESRRP